MNLAHIYKAEEIFVICPGEPIILAGSEDMAIRVAACLNALSGLTTTSILLLSALKDTNVEDPHEY